MIVFVEKGFYHAQLINAKSFGTKESGHDGQTWCGKDGIVSESIQQIHTVVFCSVLRYSYQSECVY